MPKIPTYDAQVGPDTSPIRANADAAAFGGGTGMAQLGASLINAGDTIYQAEQQREVSDAHVRMAKLRGELTADFEVKASKTAPGDTEFADNFMSSVADRLSTMGGEFRTKAGTRAFAQLSAGVAADFNAKSTSFTVALAGAKAVADWRSTVNENAGTLFNDPSQANSVFASLEYSISDPDGPFAGVPPEKKAELGQQAKEQLAIAAARGMVRNSPEMAEKMYNGGSLPGQKFLTEAGNAQIVAYIQTAQNAERAKVAIAKAGEEDAKRQAAEQDGTAIIRDIYKGGGTGVLDKILSSNLTWAQKESMINIAESHAKGGAGSRDTTTYGPGFFNLYQKVHTNEIKTPQDLWKEVGPGKALTLAGADRLANEIIGRRTPEGKNEADLKAGFVKAFTQQLSGENQLLGYRDPKGQVLVQQALVAFMGAYDAAKAAGKHPPAALLDPGNPNSLWPVVMRFKRDPNTMMRDMMPFSALGDVAPAPANNGSRGVGGAAAAAAAAPKPAKVVKFSDLPAGK